MVFLNMVFNISDFGFDCVLLVKKLWSGIIFCVWENGYKLLEVLFW